MTASPPEVEPDLAIPCPCGDGRAYARPLAVTERVRGSASRRMLTINYRHEACPIGGTIVVIDGKIRRRFGPLFSDDPFPPGSSPPVARAQPDPTAPIDQPGQPALVTDGGAD